MTSIARVSTLLSCLFTLCLLILASPLPAKAATTREPIDCAGLGMQLVAGPPERIHLRGFSLLTPAGGKWCKREPNLSNTDIILYKVTEYGRTELTAEERARSFYLRAMLVDDLPKAATTNIDTLLTYSSKPPNDDARHTFLRSEVTREDLPGFQCVRYSISNIERENPILPGLELIMETVGYLCLNPGSANTVIDVGYSERYIKDRRPGPSLMTELAPEIEPALQSLRIELNSPLMSQQALGLIVFAALAGLGFLGWVVCGIIALRREKSERRLSRSAFAPWWATSTGLVLFFFFGRLSPDIAQSIAFGLALLALVVIAPPIFAFFFFQRVVWRARDAVFGNRIAYLSIIPIINIVTIAILALTPSKDNPAAALGPTDPPSR